MAWPLATQTVRLLFLRTLETAAATAKTDRRSDEPEPSPSTSFAVSNAVLTDPQRRLCAFGGREGLPRSLASVYACFVTLFLGGGLRGAEQRRFQLPDRRNISSGRMAVSRDGATLFMVYCHDTLRKFHVDDGSPLYSKFIQGNCIAVARDGNVIVGSRASADVFTPRLIWLESFGRGTLSTPVGVCGDEDVIVVAEEEEHFDDAANTMQGSCIFVFRRADGKLLATFGHQVLVYARAVCFMACHRRVAVAEDGARKCIAIYSIDGAFQRTVGAGVLSRPTGVACSAFDELVVADKGLRCVVLFTADGDVARRIGRDEPFLSVALHSATIYAYKSHPFDMRERENAHVVVFQ
jgi:hypothetical protein